MHTGISPLTLGIFLSSSKQLHKTLDSSRGMSARRNPSRASFTSEFLSKATIHGFNQLSKPAHSTAKRIFWIFVLLSSAAGGAYEIYQIVTYYRLKPSATQVSWTLQNEYEFPPMAFCPKRWLDLRKAEELGLTQELLAYTISFLHADVEFENLHFNEERLAREIQKVMERTGINSYTELIKRIAHNAEGQLRVISTPSNVSFFPSIVGDRLCYVIKVAPLKWGMLRSQVMLKFKYNMPSSAQKYDKRHTKMLINDWRSQKTNYVALTKNGIYEVAFTAEVHHRLSRFDKPCLEFEEAALQNAYTSISCETQCISMERIRRRCLPCAHIELLQHLNLSVHEIRPCSFMAQSARSITLNKSNQRNRLNGEVCSQPEPLSTVDFCKAECVPPCKQWVFKWTTVLLSDAYMDGSVLIWITYNPIDGILAYEEVPTYTWDDFLSNVGGQLALWLGISAISVVQVIYYAFLTCAHAIDKKRFKFVAV